MKHHRSVEAIRFIRVAEMHVEAAKLIQNQLPSRGSTRLANMVIYLIGYVVECCLKARLLQETPVGRVGEELDSFRGRNAHDLLSLCDRVKRKHGSMSIVGLELIRNVASHWSVDLRYDPRSRRVDTARFVYDSAAQLLSNLRGA